MRKIALLLFFCWLTSLGVAAVPASATYRVAYRSGSAVLPKGYMSNGAALTALEATMRRNYRAGDGKSGHLRIVSYYTSATPEGVNEAALRASSLVSYLSKRLGHNGLRIAFSLRETVGEAIVEVGYAKGEHRGANSFIHFSERKEWMAAALARYTEASFPEGKPLFMTADATISPTEVQTTEVASVEMPSEVEYAGAAKELDVLIYYRFDASKFDTTYLANPRSIARMDSIMGLNSARYIESLRIIGHASPEGPLAYNTELSRRRAEAMKAFLVKRYPALLDSQTIVTQAGGENWSGLRAMVQKDERMPMREQVMTILSDGSLSEGERQQRIERLDHGRLYKGYLLPHYYRYLRTGASLFIVYDPLIPLGIDDLPLRGAASRWVRVDSLASSHARIVAPPFYWTSQRYVRPIAFKSNLLGDLATLLNVEVELPIGCRFSLLAEWNFPFWGGLGNAGGVAPIPVYTESVTLQMLAGGIEARYWFPRSSALNKQAWTWGDRNPLVGWFVGLYGGAGLYDFQLGEEGAQGDFFASGGVSGGYAHPISKNWHIEYSVAVGYLQTQYYNYTMRDGHKVVNIREDGYYDRRQQSYFGPTKLKVSLVWIPQFRIKGQRVRVNGVATQLK